MRLSSTIIHSLLFTLLYLKESFRSEESYTYRHHNTRYRDIRTESLANARALPKRSNEIVFLIAVHDTRKYGVEVGRCADGEEEDEEKRLEVEERSL